MVPSQLSRACVTRHEEKARGKRFLSLRRRPSVEQKTYASTFFAAPCHAADERIDSVRVICQVVLTKARGKREGQVQQLSLADRMPEMETHAPAGGVFAGY